MQIMTKNFAYVVNVNVMLKIVNIKIFLEIVKKNAEKILIILDFINVKKKTIYA